MDLQIVPASPKYAADSFRMRNQASTLAHNPVMPITEDQCRLLLEKDESDLSKLRAGVTFRWLALLDGELVGNFSIKNFNEQMLTADVGYGVDEAKQGQGIGTELVRLLVHKVFSETELRKLIAFVHDKNTPSRRLLEKVGFSEEGLLREHYLINGEPANEVIYGILRREVIN